ncbi:unnamed protein product [Brassicogethes aeneus]|uniref:(3R)-3-hydroxyacyl-CoA dehydrogenase n=1 Tax=Brassicogethes aeneus TaxID=1431903 RepID=A0A9P0FAZ9_BRAAE|nr:unnamed protein product [Brassicogethes aeneus]
MSLIGKLAFVTGAGSGIGRETCKILAREGANVVAADKFLKNASDTAENLPKKADQSHTSVELDVTKKTSVQYTLKKTLEIYGKPPSIIVNSAGITKDNFVLKLSEEDFQDVIDVNLKGTFLVIQTFCNAITENKLKNASVINIASIVGKYGNIGQSNYCASKAGVELLTKSSAKELGQFGIRVNAILPGIIDTAMIQTVPDKVKQKFKSVISLGRFGQPQEIGEVIAFLASDKSSYISGASIEVTGGM